mmetsp:Transcript_15312/g.34225  ORF Transcript_15312/g.34225 Transcript_15312/m.34225 type:complete len:104 (+) Transcript_15312:496-807(+)
MGTHTHIHITLPCPQSQWAAARGARCGTSLPPSRVLPVKESSPMVTDLGLKDMLRLRKAALWRSVKPRARYKLQLNQVKAVDLLTVVWWDLTTPVCACECVCV